MRLTESQSRGGECGRGPFANEAWLRIWVAHRKGRGTHKRGGARSGIWQVLILGHSATDDLIDRSCLVPLLLEVDSVRDGPLETGIRLLVKVGRSCKVCLEQLLDPGSALGSTVQILGHFGENRILGDFQ